MKMRLKYRELSLDELAGKFRYVTKKQQGFTTCGLNSLPNNKMLAWSKLKTFADDKSNRLLKRSFLSLIAFSPFPKMFVKCFFFRFVKNLECW